MCFFGALLGGSWVVISRVISGLTILITNIKGLIAPLITTHEPPSTIVCDLTYFTFVRRRSAELQRRVSDLRLLGGSWVAIRVPLRVPLKGSIEIL